MHVIMLNGKIPKVRELMISQPLGIFAYEACLETNDEVFLLNESALSEVILVDRKGIMHNCDRAMSPHQIRTFVLEEGSREPS